MAVAAVIGHGRSPERTGWGELINGCDLVYRLWDWTWQDRADYGAKFDYGYFTAHPYYIRTWSAHNKALPTIGWVGEICSNQPASLPPPHKSTLCVSDRWTAVGRKLGGVGADGRFCLTRGTFLACWAAETLPEDSTLILVGFDNVRQKRCLPLEAAFSQQFRANHGTISFGGYRGTGTKDGPHDFLVEEEIIRTIAAERNITVVHAQDIWASSGSYDMAVIGHGKSPVGRGWAGKIDACNVVMRMWDCQWQDAADYGTKFSYGFFEAHDSALRLFHKGCTVKPEVGWIGSSSHKTRRPNVPRGTQLFSPDSYLALGKELGGRGRLTFTRGTLAALWVLEQVALSDRVILVGFDNVRAGKCLPVSDGFPEAYLAAPTTYTFQGYAEGETRHGGHDFSIERRVLERVAERREAKICFADDIW